MYYVSSNGKKTAVISQDLDAENPRDSDYQDNITHMICWHPRYNLGDKHAYKGPMDFFLELAEKHGNVDEDLLSTWDVKELVHFCESLEDVKIMPLYLYDHSGLSMSTGSFIGRSPHAEWDSGRVGFIYMDKETAMSDLGNVTEANWKEAAERIMKADVQEYDNYLTGEIYGYQLYEGLRETDSCWGFNPGTEEITEVLKMELSGWLEPDMDFELCWGDDFDIEDFYQVHEFPEFRARLREAVESVILFQHELPTVFPFAMSMEKLLSNKDGVLDDIVSSLYAEHEEPDNHRIYEAIYEYAGVSREVKPKITASDLEENRDYTAEEIMEIIHHKPSLQDMIADAAAKSALQLQDSGKVLKMERE